MARAALAGIVLAAVAGLQALRLGGGAGARSAVAVRVADRDGDAVVLLDEELIEVGRVPLRRPVRLAAAGGGRVWVALAMEASPLGVHDLVLLGAGGEELLRRSGGVLLDLDGGERALLVEAGDGDEACARWLAPSGETRTLACLPGLHGAAVRDGWVLLMAGEGELVLLEARPDGGGDPIGRCRPGGEVLDVAAAPAGWWALTRAPGAGATVLTRLDAGLAPLWSVPTGLDARRLIPAPRQERVWLSDPRTGSVHRFGASGRLEASVKASLAGAGAGRAAPDGGVLLAAPGALLRLDRMGSPRPGQGGFAHLADVERGP